jgi:SAM-dependent methyltransferase
LTERFDRSYFDKWYRREGFGSASELARRVAYAVGAAEYLLGRPVRRVLDVGCGEGSWQPVLARLRPRARYIGVDPSDYAIRRFGPRRHLRQGGLADLERIVAVEEGPFDLVVCVDVLGYVTDGDAIAGLRAIASRLGGLALIEVFTSRDDFVGDVAVYRRRSPSRYRRWMADVGLVQVGPHLFAPTDEVAGWSTFEAPASPSS